MTQTTTRVAVRKQSAWGLWWLVGLTAGIYYLVWYHRINRELAEVVGDFDPRAWTKWWSQIIPIFGIIALRRTAKRLNAAHESVQSPVRVSLIMTWLWAPIWFSSHTRYLQRRVNALHDVQVSQGLLSIS